MSEPKFEVVDYANGGGNTAGPFRFALLDPNGLVVSRSWARSHLDRRCRELQNVFEMGLHWQEPKRREDYSCRATSTR